ncbi:MAG TPA: phage holin family protein [Candidatus Lokiarchaeia archaeon]|nr:phage holin family protein [Candidatus Lokiarchaeia archaeon]
MTKCYACTRDVFLPTNSNHPPTNICTICGNVFCTLHGKPYVCMKCLDRMEQGDKQQILDANKTYRGRFGGGIAMIVIGAVLLFSALVTGMVAWIISLTYHLSTPFMIVAAVLVIVGLCLLCGGVNSIKNAKAPLRSALGRIRSHASTYSGASSAPPVSWNVEQPRQSSIPPSAFIPEPEHGEMASQSRIPQSAFVSQARVSQELSKNPGEREIPGTIVPPSKETVMKYCNLCGNPLPQDIELRFCPSCGQEIID